MTGTDSGTPDASRNGRARLYRKCHAELMALADDWYVTLAIQALSRLPTSARDNTRVPCYLLWH